MVKEYAVDQPLDDSAVTKPTSLELQLGGRTFRIADPSMHDLYRLIRRLAANRLPVLVRGESGVGKELVARALHEFSPWQHAPFVPINCGALPAGLVESELFGHEKGSFSGAHGAKQGLFEAASGGTLFLDEIGELPLELQKRLLRFLDDHQVRRVGGVTARSLDVRIVAATNRDLRALVADGVFRGDLYFRLRGADLEVPPLRARRADIRVLAHDLLHAACMCNDRPILRISESAILALLRHAWPGNVRELKHAMELAAAVVEANEVHVEHLGDDIRSGIRAADETIPRRSTAPTFMRIDDEVRELIRTRMLEALEASNGVVSRAARIIGMPRRTFVKRMRQYRLRTRDPSLSTACAGSRTAKLIPQR